MADVARLAQVSTAAVSYFFSEQEEHVLRVGPAARERIQQAVSQLGYVQNKTARHLRRQRTERICILLSRLGTPFADKMTSDIETVARRHGLLTIILTGNDKNGFQRVLAEVEAGLADGLIAEADGLTLAELDEIFGPYTRSTRPCLIIHPTATPRSYSVLCHEREAALHLAIDHLLARGHRHIAYMENSGVLVNSRTQSLVKRAAQSNGQLHFSMFDGADSRDTATSRAREILAMPKRPSALVLESDFSAVSVLEEFSRLGVSVPDDIAVIGCGNAIEGYYANPRLTTIGPRGLSLTEASEHLINALDRSTRSTPHKFTVPWTLYVRESA
ncbi:LacI family DNA-binding transcriptional regulator [Devosia algicola]|uniref:LacI family DNA-binding transcriptional regulator n=1 Tax=Devosia algicola TaxID=3026418 RepID=A0ABY7YJU8_9HYPH|nr:LacI family DNA-binding transcriptional regulator [Devosia algicola]WDR01359.1 LacI family DNA-binding transcriptional regulator [Devosia algicola]